MIETIYQVFGLVLCSTQNVQFYTIDVLLLSKLAMEIYSQCPYLYLTHITSLRQQKRRDLIRRPNHIFHLGRVKSAVNIRAFIAISKRFYQ